MTRRITCSVRMKAGGWPESALIGGVLLVLPLIAPARDLKPVDSQVMLRGYCLAGSRADTEAPGGYGTSDNFPAKLRNKDHGADGMISLVALPEERLTFAGSYEGFRLLLINRSNKEAALEASDSRLPIVQQARDKGGSWRSIEYLPSSWCGNSFHRVFLPAGTCWAFTAPRYTGKLRTKLRFVLEGQGPIYSNEFEGSINPSQFTKKQGHRSSNLMDPYQD